MTLKKFCEQCKKNVPIICGNCETPILKEKKCFNCGSFRIACSICSNNLK